MNRWISMLLVAGLLSAGGVAETVPVEPQQLEEPVAEESAAPTEAPAPEEASEEPLAETPAPEESAAPDETPAPEESAVPEVTPLPEFEGYLLDAQGVRLQGGALKALLQVEGALRVCVCTQNRIHLENFPLYRLNEIEFLPDAALNGRYRVVLSASDDPSDEYTPEVIAVLPEDAMGDLYIWLMEEQLEPPQTPRPGARASGVPGGLLCGALELRAAHLPPQRHR